MHLVDRFGRIILITGKINITGTSNTAENVLIQKLQPKVKEVTHTLCHVLYIT